jgi:flagellar biosynthetic protein FlhB
MADKSQQTEDATPRKLQKAREDGQFPSAREFVNAAHFLVFVSLLGAYAPRWFTTLRIDTRALLHNAFAPALSTTALIRLLQTSISRTAFSLVKLGLVLVVITVCAQFAVTQFGLSWKRVAPQFGQLNPLQHLKRIPRDNVPSFVQALFMIPIFGYLVYYIVRERLEQFVALPGANLLTSLTLVSGAVQSLLWRGGALMMAFGLVHLVRQRRRYSSDMRMSKQQVKDEHKEAAGNPHVKQRIRRLQRELRRRNMMKDVASATAVIVNPTHFAVAIRYELNSMAAPKVVAKGKDHLALRIRRVALEHQVPLIENPPLAQALYKTAEVGQEIPAHLFRAVAEILAYIYKLMNGRFPG